MTEDEEQVSAKFVSNPTYLLEQLGSLVNVQSLLNDTMIVRRDFSGTQEQFYCNSALLSCLSPVFKSMLTNDDFEECQTKVIFIPALPRETGEEQTEQELDEECFVPSETFLEFIRFCTCAKCHLSEENVDALLLLSQQYSVYGLLECCIKYITDRFIMNGLPQDRVNRILQEVYLL